jgi:hypothetical protein
MYKNGTMRPVETVPGMGRRGGQGRMIKGEFNYDTL